MSTLLVCRYGHWISNSKPGDPEHMAGVKEFIDFTISNSVGRTRLPCLCFRCHNFSHKRVDEILNHFNKSTFDRTYTIWSWHGEYTEGYSGKSVEEGPTIDEGDRLEDMLQEVHDKFYENPSALEKLLVDSEKPLYKRCGRYIL